MGLFDRRREVGELNEKVADIMEQGYLAYEQGDYATSARKFRLALDYLLVEYDLTTDLYLSGRVADVGEIFNMTVQSYINIGSFDEAISLIESNEKMFKNRRRALLMKASIYSAKGEFGSELETYDALLGIDRKDTIVYIRKAELLSRRKKADDKEIREILNKAARNQKASDIPLGVKLAAAYRTILGDHDASQYVLDRLTPKKPCKEIFLERAEAHLQTGRIEESLSCLQKALELDENYIDGMKAMIRAYQRSGEHQKAREVCDRGLKIDPSDPDLQGYYRELSGNSALMRKVKRESTYL
ncbi:MAG: tetratricopeptide repeat protein [Candidatus Thermoplasmatota archaeon]|nr:tetratricopeptide repeat protein [Candidatus Thermoplasmatota archaeon]